MQCLPHPYTHTHSIFFRQLLATLGYYTNLSGGGFSISSGIRALAVSLLITEVIKFQEEGRNRKQTHLVKQVMAWAKQLIFFLWSESYYLPTRMQVQAKAKERPELSFISRATQRKTRGAHSLREPQELHQPS